MRALSHWCDVCTLCPSRAERRGAALAAGIGEGCSGVEAPAALAPRLLLVAAIDVA